MKNKCKKLLSLLLVVCILFSIFTVNLTVNAVETATPKATPTVEIVSFMRGPQEDLRASELLEARLTGYDGNPRELTYKWENSLGTYLYVYNSHNMYYIDGTDGEIEIYNNSVPSSTNMSGRSYKDSFTKQGYCWAAIYGSNTSGTGGSISKQDAYTGTIKVTVYDKNNNVIATDSHEGKVTSSGFLWWSTYEYDGIVESSIKDDLDDVTIGMFEGDTRNVKDLLGESAIVHITCVESDVATGNIVSGNEHIALSQDGDYYITGTNAGTSTNSEGDAKVELKISKDACKFHEESSGSATTTVYVFKKPTTSTTAYTLTLTGGIDDRCRYFIDGKEGVKQNDNTILFEGLKPNTEYMVEVRAEYKDKNNTTKYTYAYVYDTTKPIYNGTVEVYLDGTYNSATHTATGTKVNLEDVSQYSTVYAKEINGSEFIELKKVENTVGTYTNILDSGSYQLYYTADESTLIDDQLLIMHNADRTRYVFYNSVTYKNDNTELKKDYHVTNSAVNVWDEIPVKEGWVFAGWKDESDGTIYKSTDILSQNISRPYILTAQWEEGADVYVNITLDHKSDDLSVNNDKAIHNITYDLMTKSQSSSNYEDVLTKTIAWDGESEFNVDGYNVKYTDDKIYTYYTATKPVATNVLKSSDYTLEIEKSGYDLKTITKTTDANGNIILEAVLKYAPKNQDFKFSVELDEKAKSLPQNLLPNAAHVKVTCWYDTPFDDENVVNWNAITQHKDSFITVNLDENGVGYGSYPVWAQTTDGANYHYRIELVSYLLPDGSVLPAKDGTEIENSHAQEKYTEYCTDDQRYHADIVVTDGACPNSAETKLTGAYFNGSVQQGNVKAVISVKTHTVTFEPNGGKFTDGTTENKQAENQIVVPNLDNYAVTKDGGYVFDGWYLVDKNGEVTDKTVTSGSELFEDITLRAKWREPLTVEGLISIAGYYHLKDNNNTIKIIPFNERAAHITIYLQKYLPNNYTETIVTQKVHIAYNDSELGDNDKPMGTVPYRFEGIPNDGSKYRVLISNPNYLTNYQHEDESLDENKKFDYENYYNELDFDAEFGETDPNKADVNVFMEFTPTEFNLHYAINAESIGEGFRPDAAKILVNCNDGNSGQHPQDWPAISQMINGDGSYDVDDTTITNGKGSGVYPVWQNKTDGHTLFDYGVELYKYTVNGTERTLDVESAPFFVYYNGHARYSALDGLTPEHQTQLLTIQLDPKMYTVTFDVNFTESEEDHVTNMEAYAKQDGNKLTYRTGHIWSYDTDISQVVPKRDGYKFLGWYDSNDNLVTNIDASVHENVTVTAKWEKAFKVTFHINNPEFTNDIFRTYYENGVEIGDADALYLNADGTLDSFYDIPEFKYKTHNNYVFKGWYLDKDGDNPRPIKWSDKYTEDTDIYAHWILVENVDKETADTKAYDFSGKYPGFDLLGVQIRDVEKEDADHHGNEGTGLRFVTVLSESVYEQINALSSSETEYGYVMAKESTAQQNAGSNENYELQYKDSNVNGKDTNAEYSYVQNVLCSGVPDHFDGENYRLYTAVVTYKNLEGDKLAQAHSQKLVARSYIRYTDANGLLRTHYNNYTGTNTYSGCSASFDLAKSLMNG